jgi:hypothetical protein
VFDMGVERARLAQPEMITRQHYTWLSWIPRPRSRVPRAVSFQGFDPADQIPRGASNRARPR